VPRAGRLGRQLRKRRDAGKIGAVAAGDELATLKVECRQRLGERRRIGDVDEPGLEQGSDVPELDVVLALQRIGDRDRGNRDCGRVRGERQQGMIDGIAGEDSSPGARP
jgi:hypothetical protein